MTEQLIPNIPLFRQVLAQIDMEPDLHEQSDWIVPTVCGTKHCLGGWALVLSGRYRFDSQDQCIELATGLIVDPGEEARRLLGITGLQAWGRDEREGLFDMHTTREGMQEIIEKLAAEAGVQL